MMSSMSRSSIFPFRSNCMVSISKRLMKYSISSSSPITFKKLPRAMIFSFGNSFFTWSRYLSLGP